MASKRSSLKFKLSEDDSKCVELNNEMSNLIFDKEKEIAAVVSSEVIDGKETRIKENIQVLNSDYSSHKDLMVSMNFLLELAHTDDFAILLIKYGGIQVLVKQLQRQENHKLQSCSALIFTLILSGGEAEEVLQPMLDAGAASALCSLIKTVVPMRDSDDLVRGIYHAALSICYLAKGSPFVKSEIRINGGFAALLRLLTSHDKMLMGVSLLTLNELILNSELNKLELITSKALPFIVKMLYSKNAEFQLNSVGILVSLVASSSIRKRVLAEGALTPVISLLWSEEEVICLEAVSFIRHIVSESDYENYPLEIHNAVEQLITLLRSKSDELQKNSSYVLCAIAQDPGLYDTFLHHKGISPLLDFLDVEDVKITSASAIYGFASREIAVAELIKKGAVQKLLSIDMQHYPQMILKRFKDNITQLTMKLLMQCLTQPTVHTEDKMNILLGMHQLSSQKTVRKLFASCQGDHLLVMELLNLLHTPNEELKKCACLTLSKIAQNSGASCVNEGQLRTSENFTNLPTQTDVKFIVQGKRFYSNRELLIGRSEVFRAMFASGFKETLCKDVQIGNISSDIFEMLLRFVHSGSVEIGLEYALDLYEAADQYNLLELRELCIDRMCKDIRGYNLRILYDFAKFYNILALKECCVVFTLNCCEELLSNIGYERLFYEIIPEIESFFKKKGFKFLEPSSQDAKNYSCKDPYSVCV